MTYLQFHLVFIVPPLILLLFAAARLAAVLGTRARWALPAVVVIALFYTTPWDNYLVWRGVWWYGPDRVLGTIGWVPVEEYLFFVLQPLLTGAWTYILLARDAGARRAAGGGTAAGGDTVRRAGVALYLAAAAAGALALRVESGVYAGLILVWAAPVLAAQWWFAAPAIRRRPRTFILAVGVPTLWLWVADRVAIGAGIWSISPRFTTGAHLFGLPAEEALFFLVTNLLVVQGLLLFLQPALVAAGAPPDAASRVRAQRAA